MTEYRLADGWTVQDLRTLAEVPVSLPHDAMIGATRSADAPVGYHGAYFPGGRHLYRTTLPAFDGPDVRQRLRFEGVGGEATIRVNGTSLASLDSRYREVVVDLDGHLRATGENVVEVEVDDTAQPNSRWYTGSGLYRHVWLDVTGLARFANDGITITTASITHSEAIVVIESSVDDPTESAVVRVLLRDAGATVAEATGAPGRIELPVAAPTLWSAERPHLYDVEVSILVGGVISDTRTVRVGLRTVALDAVSGLRVNGESVLLRGACIHHDSGILGAATYRGFEFRRARILKANGFNAVRSSHNPLSRDMLDACDEVGLYVIDELADVWFTPKTAADAAPRFEEVWPDDLRSMIAKDRNHASVIMYSIGNEIAESATPAGVNASKRIADMAQELDPTRPTTLAVNFLLNVLARRGTSVFARESPTEAKAKPAKRNSAVTSTVVNVISNRIGAITGIISRLPAADAASRDVLATVDIAGYNYAWSRYRGDARRHEARVVYGSESMPGDIARIWPLVEALPGVIGDFMWTGWDYLGEAGLGDWAHGPEPVALTKPYPQITAGTGAIDITGHPGVPTLLARAVWGLLDAPAIAVRPLDRSGQKVWRTAWRSSDAVPSWAWKGADGKRAEIEVYSGDDEVELIINGQVIGRRRGGKRAGYVARFTAPYAPGEIIARGWRNGQLAGESVLRSAQPAALALRVECDGAVLDADGQDLAFVHVELRDADGVVEMLDDDSVTIRTEGPGVLAGFGSGASRNEESYTTDVHRTSRGRALAIIRSTGTAGPVRVIASSKSHGDAAVTVRFA